MIRDEVTEDDPTRLIIYNKLRVKKGTTHTHTLFKSIPFLLAPKRSLEDEENCTLSLYESWQFIYKLYLNRLSKDKLCEQELEVCTLSLSDSSLIDILCLPPPLSLSLSLSLIHLLLIYSVSLPLSLSLSL